MTKFKFKINTVSEGSLFGNRPNYIIRSINILYPSYYDGAEKRHNIINTTLIVAYIFYITYDEIFKSTFLNNVFFSIYNYFW